MKCYCAKFLIFFSISDNSVWFPAPSRLNKWIECAETEFTEYSYLKDVLLCKVIAQLSKSCGNSVVFPTVVFQFIRYSREHQCFIKLQIKSHIAYSPLACRAPLFVFKYCKQNWTLWCWNAYGTYCICPMFWLSLPIVRVSFYKVDQIIYFLMFLSLGYQPRM